MPGEIRFVPTRAIADVTFDEEPEVRRLSVEQSNTSVIIGDGMVVKGYRRLEQGIHLELEVARFLTGESGIQQHAATFGRCRVCEFQRRVHGALHRPGFCSKPGQWLGFHSPSPGARL